MQLLASDLNENLPINLNKNSFDFNFISKSEEDTKRLAYYFSSILKGNEIIVLNGDLGSGKTAFMQGVAKYYNIEDQISSPTFTIVNEYITKDKNNIFHFDVYRLEDEIEFSEQIGTDYFENGICFIEWGNIIKNILPKNTIFIDIKKDEKDFNTRYIHIWRDKNEHTCN